MIIYKATNKINGKCYIGQTINTLHTRMVSHKTQSKSSKTHFHNAIRKYGWHNFTWEIIDITCQNKNELNEMEYPYIKQLGDYNITEGGDGVQLLGKANGMYGKLHTIESKNKMSKNITKKFGKQNHFYGKHHSKETIKTISNIKKIQTQGSNNPNAKRWLITTHLGETIILKSLTSFCKDNKLNYNCMILLAKGLIKQGHHKGFKCSLLS